LPIASAYGELVRAQPTIHLEVKDSEGWFGPKFPRTMWMNCISRLLASSKTWIG